jgi:hypothetical protein
LVASDSLIPAFNFLGLLPGHVRGRNVTATLTLTLFRLKVTKKLDGKSLAETKRKNGEFSFA